MKTRFTSVPGVGIFPGVAAIFGKSGLLKGFLSTSLFEKIKKDLNYGQTWVTKNVTSGVINKVLYLFRSVVRDVPPERTFVGSIPVAG